MDIAQSFARTVRRLSKHPMIIFRQELFTFEHLDDISSRLAGGLASLGVQQGDLVSIGLPNGPEIIISFLAAAKLGAIVVPLNPTLKEKELTYIFRDCSVKAAVTFEKHAEIFQTLKSRGSDVPRVVLVGKEAEGGALCFHDLLKEGGTSFRRTPIQEDDLFLIVYTSGTTGEPKGVMLTHGNVLAVARVVAETQRRSEQDRSVCFFPLTHITGIVNFFADSVSIGSTIVLQERFEVNEFLACFGRYQCTALGAVSPVFQAILGSPELAACDFSKLRLITSGGASLPVELYQKLKERFGVPILEMYGMTENAATLTSNPLEKQKRGSVGVPLPGMAVRVVDKHDRDLPSGEVGEVVARGPGIMKGYHRKPDLTAKALRGGWYHTGDLGKMDEEGFLYIVDRKDDMINAGAFKIYPREVEEVLYSHPVVQDCAVVGVPDDRLGQVPIAFVVTKEGKKINGESLRDFCRERIANYKVPRRFHFTDELPRTAQGKIMKRFLTETP